MVSLRTNYLNDEGIKGWVIDEDIVITERYQSGDPYIYYDFIMPRHEVTAIYGESIDPHIDLAKSSIIFEENVDIGSRLQNGFWYKSTIRGMIPLYHDDEKGNFYVWDNAEPLYVTSNGVATQNQLKIVNGMTVYLKNCNLIATDSYLNNVKNRTINNAEITRADSGSDGLNNFVNGNRDAISDLSDFGNIVIDASNHPNYIVNLYIEGNENSIHSVFSDAIRSETSYSNNLNIYSADSDTAKLTLGTMVGNFYYNLNNIEVDELDQESDNFEYLFYSSKGSFRATKSVINTPDKSVFTGNSSFNITDTNMKLKNLIAYNGCSSGGNSYLRAYGNVYVGYVPFSLRGNSSAVIDGDIIHNYQHASSITTMDSTGYLIVKGTRFMASSINITNTTVIANILTLGKSSNLSKATVITNQISNSIENGWKYTNDFVLTTSSGTELKQNNDDYPFTTYSQSSEGNTQFKFMTNSDIYLLGHYKTIDKKYDTNVKATDSDNPIHKYLDLLLDENGDLKENATIDKTEVKNDVKMSTNTSKECFVLGNSNYNYDGLLREIVIDGANIYCAGNINFFNDTQIKSGNIYANGNVSSKLNFTINGGTIEANEVGNSYNFKTTISDNIFAWKKTIINGGTIKANRIGALSSCAANNTITPQSTVNINALESVTQNTSVVHDVYMNYIYNSNQFTNNNTLNSIRFHTNWDQNNVTWLAEDEITFYEPNLKNSSETGKWKLNSLTGPFITNVSSTGIIQNEGAYIDHAYDKDDIVLFATKSNYKIEVKSGTDKYNSFMDSNNQTLNLNNVPVGENVTLVLNDNEYINKTVIWYKDDSGIIHNVMPSKSGNNITFEMPASDIEVYISDDIILNLSDSSLTITKSGFITELEITREDSSFDYEGNIIIEQSELSNVTTSMFATTNNSRFTNNQILVKSDVDNLTTDRNITLRKILQYGGAMTIGLKLEDEAKTKITIDGPVQLFRIEVPERSEIILKGKNGNSKDYLAALATGNSTYNNVGLGTYSGKAGNMTLEDLTIHAYAGRLVGFIGSSATKTTNTMTYRNCSLNFSNWYSSSYLARNMEKVIFENTNGYFKNTASWPSSLFVGITDVVLKDTNFEYLSNSSYSSNGSFPLFYGISNQLLLDHSSIKDTLAVPTTNHIYKTLQQTNNTAKEIKLINGSVFNTEERVRIRRLVLNDSTVNVGENSGGYLLSSDIEVNDQSSLNAGYIIVSGFYDSKGTTAGSEPVTKDAVIAKLKVASNVMDGKNEKGLIINGGTVSVKEFVGGDVNGKITVHNGTLRAKSIGTSGKLYGYGTYVPHKITENGVTYIEDYMYTYDKIPSTGTNVTVDQTGTIEVFENGYLGGMNATVEIKGGMVKLNKDAILGINDSDKTTLFNDTTSRGLNPEELVNIKIVDGEVTGVEANIKVPYSTLNISGENTGINVKNIEADKGEIHIEEIKNKYDNPYISDHGEALHDRVGMIVHGKLSAQNLIIDKGAIVYAKRALANAIDEEDEALLRVSYNDVKSYLYADAYGSEGKGSSIIDVQDNAFLHRQYTIFYHLNDTYVDQADNPNYSGYIEGEEMILEDATRFGYRFDGWYNTSGDKVTSISPISTGDIELEAKWTALKVKFKVSVKASEIGLSDLSDEVDLSKGSFDDSGNVFTYHDIVEIDYRDLFIGTNQINLPNYDLKSYSIMGIKIDNDDLNPDKDEINVYTSRVSKEIMEYYLNHGSNPIDITVTVISAK